MRTLAPFAFASGVDPALLRTFIEKKSGDIQDPAGYAAQIQAVLAHDAGARLGDIGSPTLILTGDDDRVIPGSSSDFLHEQIPVRATRGDRGQRRICSSSRNRLRRSSSCAHFSVPAEPPTHETLGA